MASSVNFGTQQYFGFNPRTLPGIQLWLDAADASTVTGTTTVTAWNDKSGKGRNLGVGSGTTSYGAYGPGQAIKLNNSYMFVTSAVDLTNATVFIVSAGPTLVGNQSVFCGRPNTSASWNSTDGFGFYIDTNGDRVYGTAGLTNTFAISLPFLTSFTLPSTGLVSSWQNGATGATASGGARASTAQGFSIGGEWQGGSYANFTSQAYLYEIIVYNGVLSQSQRQTVEGYLAWKWQLSRVSAFPPSGVAAPLLWFDAADTTTINGTTQVTRWANKGSVGGFASNVTGSCTSGNTLNNGTNYVRCPAGTELNFTAALNTQARSWFVVARVVSTLGATTPTYAAVINQTAGGGQDSLSTGYVNASSNFMGIGPSGVFAAVVTNSASPTLLNSVFTTSVINSTTVASNILTLNGTSQTLNGGNAAASAYNTGSLTYRISTASYSSTIDIMEISFFAGDLTSTNRQIIEGYMAWKWGISATLPAGHPYYSAPPVGYAQPALSVSHPYYSQPPYMRTFSPLDVPGCKMWLDGADLSTMTPAGATAGTSITAWKDKSSNAITFASGAVAAQAGSTLASPTFVAGGGLFFNNSLSGAWVNGTTQGYSVAPGYTGNFTNFTMFVVATQPSGTTGYNSLIFVQGAGTYPSPFSFVDFDAMGPGGYGGLFIDNVLNASFNNSKFPATLRTLDMLDVKPTGATFFYNGVSNSTTAFTYTQTVFPVIAGVYIGNQAPGARSFPGTIYEMIWYEGQSLTVPQRLQIEGYLQWKWQSTALPSTHSFFGFAPAAIANFSTVAPLVQLRAIKYSGSGTWNDESPYARNATIENGTAAKNAVGNGVVLNGSTSWKFPDVGSLSTWTLVAWWKTTGYNGTNPALVTQQYPGTSSKINMVLGIGAVNVGGSFFDGNWRGGTSIGSLPSKWTNHHITWDGGTLSTYVNGVLLGTTAPGGSTTSGGGQYLIGRRWDGLEYIIGTVGEVRIYGYTFNAGQCYTDYTNVASSTLYNY